MLDNSAIIVEIVQLAKTGSQHERDRGSGQGGHSPCGRGSERNHRPAAAGWSAQTGQWHRQRCGGPDPGDPVFPRRARVSFSAVSDHAGIAPEIFCRPDSPHHVRLHGGGRIDQPAQCDVQAPAQPERGSRRADHRHPDSWRLPCPGCRLPRQHAVHRPGLVHS